MNHRSWFVAVWLAFTIFWVCACVLVTAFGVADLAQWLNVLRSKEFQRILLLPPMGTAALLGVARMIGGIFGLHRGRR
jgi:hypothetical protein